MKRLIFLIIAFVLLVGGVSAFSTNFQSSSDMQYYSVVNTATIGSASWTTNPITGNSYAYSKIDPCGVFTDQKVYFINTNAQPTTYWGGTLIGGSTGFQNGYPYLVLMDANHNIMQELYPEGDGSRFEIKIVGGTLSYYKDGVLAQTWTTPLSVNPSYIGFGGGKNFQSWPSVGQLTQWDDIVYGDSENKYIFGMPSDSTYILIKDMINPANSGFAYAPNNTIISTYNMTSTYGYSNINSIGSQNVVLQSYGSASSGTVYGTYATGSHPAGSIVWPIADDLFNSGAPYGYYYTTVVGSGATSNIIAYIGNGATIAWGSKTYAQGDTAVISYSISNSYFTSGYTYKISIQDAYGNIITNKTITTQTGTVTNTFTSSNNQGVYYASLYATPITGGSNILMNFDYTTLSGYITFNGNVYNAQTLSTISGALVNISQNGLVQNTTSVVGGNYSLTGYLSGSAINTTVTASGYVPYTYKFTPITAKSIHLDFSLVPITPSSTGVGIGGVARDSTYGEPISGASVVVRNLTNSESYTKSTNAMGWYICDNGASCSLVSSRLYSVWGSASQHLNSSVYTVVANGS